MSFPFWLATVMVCLPLCAGVSTSSSKILHFNIQPGAGKYQLRLHASVKQTFNSKDDADSHTVDIIENAHSTISNIQAECRGTALDANQISFHFPQSRDEFIDPGRIHRIAFPHNLKPRETIAYSYDESFEELAFFPLITVPALNRLERFEIIVEHPAGFQVDFQVFNAHSPLKPMLDRSIATRSSIVFENLPNRQTLSFDPFPWMHASVLTKISLDGTPVNPYTPAAFTKWYLGSIEPGSIPSDQMKTLLSGELHQAKSQRERMRVLFDYVKSEIRYIADEGRGHAFLPHPCSEVLEKKWGDCKDKARLLTALAKIHNIPLHLVLVNTHPAPDFAEVNIGLFNHVICAMKDGDELIFMDPTAAQSEMGDPPGSDLLAKVLVLDPDNPRYTVVPARYPTPDLELLIASDVAALDKGKAKLILRHSWRTHVLQARRELNDKNFEQHVSDRFERVLGKLPFQHFRILLEDREKLVLEADADLSEFFIMTDLRAYAPTVPFRMLDPELVERKKDSFALDAAGPANYRMTLTLTGQGLRVIPEQITLGAESGPRCTAASSGSPRESRLVYASEQPFRLVPPESRDAFFEFCNDYLKSKRQFFTFQRIIP